MDENKDWKGSLANFISSIKTNKKSIYPIFVKRTLDKQDKCLEIEQLFTVAPKVEVNLQLPAHCQEFHKRLFPRFPVLHNYKKEIPSSVEVCGLI